MNAMYRRSSLWKVDVRRRPLRTSSMAGTMSSLQPRHLRVVRVLMYCVYAQRVMVPARV